MSAFFRLFASVTKSMAQALAPSSVILLMLVLYTGFAPPVDYMRGWLSWLRWLNPIPYGFESCMINEFDGRHFNCSAFVPSGPSYSDILPAQRACQEKGSVSGDSTVSGTAYILEAFSYERGHKWRNFGVIVAMTLVLYTLQLWTSEVVASERSKGEVLVFRRGRLQQLKAKRVIVDEETGERSASDVTRSEKLDSGDSAVAAEKQTSVFHWESVCYEVQSKSETRVILDNVDGWIKPGSLTALMVSQVLYQLSEQTLTSRLVGRLWSR